MSQFQKQKVLSACFSVLEKQGLQQIDSFPLLLEELDALHFTALGYQCGELLQ